ncbi:MAG: DMSO reductase anchor subunit [Enterobacterales bacterium]|jgi:DMSO reductase anchor subunit
MHPAKSVIIFTTLSGAGYGLLFMLILGQFLGFYETTLMIEIIGHSLAFVMVSIGLLSSTFHLGHPERAWRALSQWRSSWLSREGICSLTTFVFWFFYALYRFLLNEESSANTMQLLMGSLAILLAALTVFTTSMIYRSLKAVQSWYNVYVPPLYLLFSLTSGLMLLNVILQLSQTPSDEINKLALVTLIATILLKRGYWRFIENAPRRSTIESATGLGKFGKVSALESPHSHQNYLMAEMGFQVARKHSKKLKQIFSLLFSIAILAIGVVTLGLMATVMTTVMAFVGFIAMSLAIVVERWLFFAEARHDQALYYGQ